MKKITMQTIADHIGVSKMTVSRYFNGGYVSDEIKEQIEAFVSETNYRPNVLARNLKQQQNIIGIIAPKIDNHVFNELVRGFISEAEKHNYQLLFYSTNYNSHKEDDAISSLISMNARGIIIDSNSVTIKKKHLYNIENMISFGLKSEFKNHVYFPEKLAFKSIIPDDKNINVKFVYRDYMLSTRTNIAQEVFAEFKRNRDDNILIEEKKIAENLQKNTLYICATDEIAYNLYREVNKTNLVVGQDIYVVGIGGNKINELLKPSLTSIYFPYEELAAEMVRMIVENKYQTKCSTFNVIAGESYIIDK